jgi:hypothetical protein
MHALYSYPQNRFDFGRGIFYRFGQPARPRLDLWNSGNGFSSFDK